MKSIRPQGIPMLCTPFPLLASEFILEVVFNPASQKSRGAQREFLWAIQESGVYHLCFCPVTGDYSVTWSLLTSGGTRKWGLAVHPGKRRDFGFLWSSGLHCILYCINTHTHKHTSILYMHAKLYRLTVFMFIWDNSHMWYDWWKQSEKGGSTSISLMIDLFKETVLQSVINQTARGVWAAQSVECVTDSWFSAWVLISGH